MLARTAGPVHPIAMGDAWPCALAARERELVFADKGGRLWRWDGQRATYLASGRLRPNDVALSSRWIFWTAGNRIYAVDRQSGIEHDVARCRGVAWGLCLEPSETYLYFTASDEEVGGLWAFRLADGTLSEVAHGPLLLAYPVYGGERIYCTSRIGPGGRYDFDHGAVVGVSLRDGSLTTLAAGQHLPAHLSLVGSQLFWHARSDGPFGAFRSVSVAGGPARCLPVAADTVWASVVDDTGLYWLGGLNEGPVLRADLETGETTELGTVPNAARLLASGDSSLVALDAAGAGYAIDRSARGVTRLFDGPAPPDPPGYHGPVF